MLLVILVLELNEWEHVTILFSRKLSKKLHDLCDKSKTVILHSRFKHHQIRQVADILENAFKIKFQCRVINEGKESSSIVKSDYIS
jgi:hypothetical protein